MELYCLSFSHHRLPLDIRARLHFDETSLAAASARFRCGDSPPRFLQELVIVSTCNRVELYVVVPWKAPEAAVREELVRFLGESRDLALETWIEFAVFYRGHDVAVHAARVASGLESQVLGEAQILGQMGDALRLSLVLNSAGAVLSKLFLGAVRAGRMARESTQINHNLTSISTIAVDKAIEVVGPLRDKSIVVLGAGEMAELALSHVIRRGGNRVTVVNRTIAKAQTIAERYGAQTAVLDRLTSILPDADVVITSTGAPHTILDRAIIEKAMSQRPERRLVLLDIAIPRDCAPNVCEIPGVMLWDLDSLHSISQQSFALRAQEIPKVEQIIEQEMGHFAEWRQSIDANRLIARWRWQLDQIRDTELKRLLTILPDLDERTQDAVMKFSHSLVNKLLHRPTDNLRQLDGSRQGVDYAEAVRQLFELDQDLSNAATRKVRS